MTSSGPPATSSGGLSPVVEVTISGRGGGIAYSEGEHKIPFDWEFGMSPAIVLAWGPTGAEWDARYAWAAGRQREVYEFVGAEVVRQKVSSGAFEYDLELGHLTILSETGARARGLYVNRSAAAAEELRQHGSVDAVRQALLWASYNATVCAPRCAALLLVLSGAATEPFPADVELMLGKLGKYTSDFDRDAASAELSGRVHMVLDQSPQD